MPPPTVPPLGRKPPPLHPARTLTPLLVCAPCLSHPTSPGTCSTSGVLPLRRCYLLWSLSLPPTPIPTHLQGCTLSFPSSRAALRGLGAISRKLPESQQRPAVTPPSANLATPHPCPSSPSLDESVFPQDWHWDQMQLLGGRWQEERGPRSTTGPLPPQPLTLV